MYVSINEKWNMEGCEKSEWVELLRKVTQSISKVTLRFLCDSLRLLSGTLRHSTYPRYQFLTSDNQYLMPKA
jgi:hypothetical protein